MCIRDRYNNEHNPVIPAEISNSLSPENKSVVRNKSIEQMGSELAEEYSGRRPFENSEVPFCPNTERFERPAEALKENVNSNTATFREQKVILNESHVKTEMLKDEIDELNNEIKTLQDKINTAIRKKKQCSN
eukprot:TRINITY_DN3719_c0_g1_i15.p1 TRINITY_DN3719_c0_g1~~TRINITY_DN3719_c0_g1_i15.p1  ORF type:complete len:133 (+),score=44.78 TRINITY_DN3719_c0_g1_i15:73-471(+)